MTRPFIVALSARMAVLCLPVTGAFYNLPRKISWRLLSRDDRRVHQTGTAATTIILLDGLNPETSYLLDADGLEEITFDTLACNGLVEATDYGLVPDVDPADAEGARANAHALARAVAAVPTGGTLRLGPGVWTAFPLTLASDMTFHLDAGAVLRAPSTQAGWPIMPARDADGRMLGSWEGLPDACFNAPLNAADARNLVIEGRGTIDGSGDLGDWWTWPKETRDGARRPRGLHLVSCQDVTLIGFSIRNAPSWTIHPQGCERLNAAALHISAPHDSPNTDGFNPESCIDVKITGVRFSVGDDCIAIKAGKRGPVGEDDHLSPSRNIHVSRCLMERGHGGLVIGSEMSGGVHNVSMEDCEMAGTDRGLRIKTRRGRGGAVTDIAIRRVLMDGVQTAISVNAHYHCDADGHSHEVQSRQAMPVGTGTPAIDGITIENVEIRKLAHAAGAFLGLPESPIRNVHIRNIAISFDPAATAFTPDMADFMRPLLHETIVAEQAEIDCGDPDLLSSATISISDVREIS